MQNYWNFYLACKQQQLYGPVNYQDFRETGPWTQQHVTVLNFKQTYGIVFKDMGAAGDT